MSPFPHAYWLKVLDFFRGDHRKAWVWFNEANSLLGGQKPIDMIRKGRSKKLMAFIDGQLQGWHP
jgi:hypothetical protein